MNRVSSCISARQLEQELPLVLESPSQRGLLEAIFVRPAPGERVAVPSIRVSPERGADGDRWQRDVQGSDPDSPSSTRSQISLMNSRILRLVARHDPAMALAGDNLIVDLDLSHTNLPPGSRLQIGNRVVLELTDQPHSACAKFAHRYGQEAADFINGPLGRQWNLRGRFARVLTAGTIYRGDPVTRQAADPASQ